MKVLGWLSYLLLVLGIATCARPASAADALGCTDLKLIPRVPGCVIVECSANQSDLISAIKDDPLVDAATNSVVYSCPTGIDPQRIEREVVLQLRKGAYQTVREEKDEPMSTALTARKGSQWINLKAWLEDGTATYSLLAAETGAEKSKAQTCSQPQVLSFEQRCGVAECTSKSENALQMQTSERQRTSLEGPAVTATLTCPGLNPSEIFDSAEKELKDSGFDVLFTDRAQAASYWLTARSGQRWVELTSAPEGDTMSYALTVISSANGIAVAEAKPQGADNAQGRKSTDGAPEVSSAEPQAGLKLPQPPVVAENAVAGVLTHPSAEPAAPRYPERHEIAQESAMREAVPLQSVPLASSTGGAPTRPSVPEVSTMPVRPPKPVVRIPLLVQREVSLTIRDEVSVTLLVDVNEDGLVTDANVTGRITSDVLKLQPAALDTVRRWRFEPARQGNKAVPSQTIVKLSYVPLVTR
jgi:protein TonB